MERLAESHNGPLLLSEGMQPHDYRHDGNTSNTFSMENEVKQGCVITEPPTLFS